ncbi:MAG: cytochrome P450 [Micromonosporaceae bacterium]
MGRHLSEGVDLLIFDQPELAARSTEARMQLFAYLWRLMEERRRAPTGDLMSALVTLQQESQTLSIMELIAFCISLFIAGQASTSTFISLATHDLLRHPQQLEHFRQNPDSTAIEELLRYTSALQFATRSARTDMELGGQSIRKGDVVLSMVSSANRDPEVFAEPDRLDLARDPNPHLAFGRGHHYCLGAHLARLEGQVMVSSLLRRAPALRLRAELVLKPTVWLRGLAGLPVSLR